MQMENFAPFMFAGLVLVMLIGFYVGVRHQLVE